MDELRIGIGRTAEVYEYGEQRVLKLYHPGLSEEQAEMEYRACQAACRAGLPVPEPLELVRHDGRPGIVFEKLAGVTMLAALALGESSVAREAERMAQLQSRVHRVSVQGLPSLKSSLIERIAHTSLLTDEEKKRLASLLSDLPDGDRLCHGDFHPDNILLGDQEWIIDWMTGTTGHPSADVARTALLLQYGSIPNEAPAEVVAWLVDMRVELLSGYLRAYSKETGTTREQIERWMPPVAAARLCDWIPEAEKEALAAFIRRSIAGNECE
ncbi:Phosphotransferase enzyme family protein [Cohnella sp. OV330]|uniref:phosphotransferase family protein n=1 Tax=Cohnella sp. OV330 TaxID=1855288 RepID=UPI0008E99380|nr:aminoglycoside phosphotransferase family protein [Cohnella sp. OV330]SFB60038.1 Phosphotransferase enzyme family protein [Cohnella sp. OV330]